MWPLYEKKIVFNRFIAKTKLGVKVFLFKIFCTLNEPIDFLLTLKIIL